MQESRTLQVSRSSATGFLLLTDVTCWYSRSTGGQMRPASVFWKDAGMQEPCCCRGTFGASKEASRALLAPAVVELAAGVFHSLWRQAHPVRGQGTECMICLKA